MQTLGLGFTFEGIQAAHYVVKGRNRDTAWFRLLDHEWPAARPALFAGLSRRIGLICGQTMSAVARSRRLTTATPSRATRTHASRQDGP